MMMIDTGCGCDGYDDGNEFQFWSNFSDLILGMRI